LRCVGCGFLYLRLDLRHVLVHDRLSCLDGVSSWRWYLQQLLAGGRSIEVVDGLDVGVGYL